MGLEPVSMEQVQSGQKLEVEWDAWSSCIWILFLLFPAECCLSQLVHRGSRSPAPGLFPQNLGAQQASAGEE